MFSSDAHDALLLLLEIRKQLFKYNCIINVRLYFRVQKKHFKDHYYLCNKGAIKNIFNYIL